MGTPFVFIPHAIPKFFAKNLNAISSIGTQYKVNTLAFNLQKKSGIFPETPFMVVLF